MHPGIFLLFECDEVHALLVEARSFSEIVMLHILTFIPFFVFLLYFLDLENLLELSRIRNVLEMILDFSSLELAFDCFIFTLDYLLNQFLNHSQLMLHSSLNYSCFKLHFVENSLGFS